MTAAPFALDPPELRVSPRGLLATIGAGALAVAWWPVAVALQAPAPMQFTVVLAHGG